MKDQPPTLFEPDPDVGRPRPGRFHHDGRDTERAAAESVRETTGKLRRWALDLLRLAGDSGLTDDEGGALMQGDRLKFGRRRNELVEAGLVVDSGRRRSTPGGRSAAVWTATPTPEGTPDEPTA